MDIVKKKWKMLAAVAAMAFALVMGGRPVYAEECLSVDVTGRYGQSEAREMLGMINDFRTGDEAWYWNEDDSSKIVCSNLKPLEYDYELEQTAMLRAMELAVSYGHARPNGGSCFDLFRYNAAGENIAAGHTSAAQVFEAWQETEKTYSGQGHRRNMLNSNFTAVGIGHVYCNETNYWVQVFRAPGSDAEETAANDGETVVSVQILPSKITEVELMPSADALTIVTDDSVELPELSIAISTASAFSYGGGCPVSLDYAWTVRDEGIACIQNGKLYALSAGETSITAEVLGQTAEVPIKVTSKTGEEAGQPSDSDFQIDENGVLVKYTGSGGDVTIPEGVTSIGDRAFYNRSDLTNIVIPESVTSIGEEAFYECNSLTHIVIPEGVTSIGELAFDECDRLKSVELPKSLKEIGNRAFYNWGLVIYCEKDTLAETYAKEHSIRLVAGDYRYLLKEGNMAEIVGYAGTETELTIPAELNGRKVIGIGTFRTEDYRDPTARYENITSVIIPEGVESIGFEAFKNCKSLTKIEIPESVTNIESRAFVGCSGLTSIELPENITEIKYYTFSDCSSLKAIKIPGSVTSIEGSAFSGCSSLQAIEIPGSVTSIEGGVFSGCSSLQAIEIPGSVTSIEGGVFSGCANLASIEVSNDSLYYESVEGVLFDKDKSVLIAYPEGKGTVYQIPSGVAKIKSSAFSYCNSLVSVELSDSVMSVGKFAFAGCSNLTRIKIPNSMTSIDAYAFEECDNLTIYCNKDSDAESYAKENEIPYQYIEEHDNSQAPEDTEKDDNKETETQTPSGELENPRSDDNNQSETNVSNNIPKKPENTETSKDIEDAGSNGDVKDIEDASSNGDNKDIGDTEEVSEKHEDTEEPEASKAPEKLKPQTITAKNITKTYGAKAFSLGAKANGGKLTYIVSDKKVAAVSNAGKVTIKGCGVTKITIKAAANKKYKAAEKTITLTVKPKQQKLSSVKSQKAKSIAVKWKKDTKATGYIIQYSTNKTFKKDVKTVTVKKNGTTSKTISKLKGGKKYYVRICSYKQSGKGTIRGAYSPVKAVTVRR